MIRKIKVLGLALMAVLAVSAVAASASQAVGTFTYEAGTVTLDVTHDEGSKQKFTVNAGSFECNEVHAHATSFNATDVTSTGVTFQNSGSADTCPATIGTATVSMNGCNFTFTAGETLTATSTTWGETHVICPAGAVISVNVAGVCNVEVGAQTVKGGHVVYKTVNNPKTSKTDVTVEVTVSGITYDQTGIFCPGGGTSHASNGTYTGLLTVEGTNSAGGYTNISVS